MKHVRHHSRPQEEGAGSPAGASLAAGAGRSEIEEARRPLDGHPTVTAARIVCCMTKPCVNKSASKSVACTSHFILFLYFLLILIHMEFIAAHFPFLELLPIFWSVPGLKN